MNPEANNTNKRPNLWFNVVFVSVILFANIFPLTLAWQDKSWGALWIAFIGAPIINGSFAAVGLLAIPFLSRRPNFSIFMHLVYSFGIPFAVSLFDIVVILSMGLHGC